MRNPTTPHEIHVTRMVAFHQAAFHQYKERSGQTHREATNTLQRVFSEGGEIASHQLVDALVDPELHSSVWAKEHQDFMAKHYPHLVALKPEPLPIAIPEEPRKLVQLTIF